MEEVKDLLKDIMANVESHREEFKKERGRKLQAIKESSLNVNVECITKLTDKNEMIVFIEECYKCVGCKNPDLCTMGTPLYRPVIEFNNGSYGLIYEKCGKGRGYVNANLELKNFSDYDLQSNKKSAIDKLLKGTGAFLWGEPGRGKTYMMAYVCNLFNQQGKSIFFHLSSYIEKTYMDFQTRNELLDEMLNVDILVVDDFGGSGFNKNAIRGLWETVIKQRVDNNKPIYFVSNYNMRYVLDEIKRVTYDDVLVCAIEDRLQMQGEIPYKDKNYRR